MTPCLHTYGRESMTKPQLHQKQPTYRSRGFTVLEMLLVVAIAIVIAAFAVPKYMTIQSSLRIAEDMRNLAGLTSQAKLRAAADFTHARVYANLNGGTYQLEDWYKAGNGGSGCWVADSDPTNTCLTFTSGAPSGTVITLSNGDT